VTILQKHKGAVKLPFVWPGNTVMTHHRGFAIHAQKVIFHFEVTPGVRSAKMAHLRIYQTRGHATSVQLVGKGVRHERTKQSVKFVQTVKKQNTSENQFAKVVLLASLRDQAKPVKTAQLGGFGEQKIQLRRAKPAFLVNPPILKPERKYVQ
jgi:hypothetical protein